MKMIEHGIIFIKRVLRNKYVKFISQVTVFIYIFYYLDMAANIQYLEEIWQLLLANFIEYTLKSISNIGLFLISIHAAQFKFIENITKLVKLNILLFKSFFVYSVLPAAILGYSLVWYAVNKLPVLAYQLPVMLVSLLADLASVAVLFSFIGFCFMKHRQNMLTNKLKALIEDDCFSVENFKKIKQYISAGANISDLNQGEKLKILNLFFKVKKPELADFFNLLQENIFNRVKTEVQVARDLYEGEAPVGVLHVLRITMNFVLSGTAFKLFNFVAGRNPITDFIRNGGNKGIVDKIFNALQEKIPEDDDYLMISALGFNLKEYTAEDLKRIFTNRDFVILFAAECVDSVADVVRTVQRRVIRGEIRSHAENPIFQKVLLTAQEVLKRETRMTATLRAAAAAAKTEKMRIEADAAAERIRAGSATRALEANRAVVTAREREREAIIALQRTGASRAAGMVVVDARAGAIAAEDNMARALHELRNSPHGITGRRVAGWVNVSKGHWEEDSVAVQRPCSH